MRASHAIVGLLTTLLCVGALAACGGGDSASGDDATTEAAATTEEAAGTTEAASSETADSSTTEAAGGELDPSLPPVVIPVITVKIPGVDLLTPHAAGAKAAAEKINAAGGFGGREVVVEECATDLTPATATVCANRTVNEEGVIAEMGCEPAWGVSGLEIYAQAGIPSLNCVNTEVDLTNEWSFGIHPGATGAVAAMAAWLCAQDDVQTVAFLGQDIPQLRKDEQAATQPIIEACGKQISYVWVPIDATDFTPYINEAVGSDPDFIVTFQSPAPTAQAFKSLQQAGYPIEQTGAIGSSCGYETTLELAGSAMDGTICFDGWVPWDDESDPAIAEYSAAMEQYSPDVDPRGSAQWGYASVMWIYTAGEEIGFDNFTPEAFAEYMRTATGVPIPISRDWINPGPEGRPQIKQPSTIFMRWQDGKFAIVEDGTDGGWVDGYAALSEAQGS